MRTLSGITIAFALALVNDVWRHDEGGLDERAAAKGGCTPKEVEGNMIRLLKSTAR